MIGTPEQRFFNKVEMLPDAPGCWLWSGYVAENGYGTITINKYPVLVHRFAYELSRGRISHGLHVLHRCDVKCCVNPEHLFTGTPLDNMLDKVAKGRQANGEKNGNARLTAEAVADIRDNPLATLDFLSRRHGVSITTVWDVRMRHTWVHL